ncbi:MAG: SPOR domain-containing protein [Draconibacterium sp.]|nr:SPOR domain-containing protein [Draconibacterium sp.]
MVLNLSNFIYSLLLENDTVIIPGFGAFVSTYKPAVILENEIKPPSKEISFTQKIKNNDGMLAEIIARKAKISQSYAMKRIEKAHENMLYELDKGETVIIENIGTLVYNEKNEIQFTPFQDENLLLDSFGLETISKEDVIKKIEIVNIETPVIEEVVDPEEIAEIIDETETESIVAPIEEETEIKAEEIISPVIEKEDEVIQEKKSEIKHFPEFKTAEKSERHEERKKTGWYWYLLILIPILITGFFILNNKSKNSETTTDTEVSSNIQQQNTQPETAVPVDSTENNLDDTIEPETAMNVSPEKTVSNGVSKFYIVGGGFKNEEKVEKYILKLKEKGINGFALGQKGKLYLVGIDSFDNESDAQESLNKLVKANPGWNLWIYEK